jgi:glutathione/glutaredoxin type arsenate reductase
MKKSVAFVCVHNSCRSQMAEGFAKEFGDDVLDVYSAGTEQYHQVKPKAVEVMKEVGIDISNQYPKLLEDIPQEIDILITMGCGAACPFLINDYEEDWGIEDPSGKSLSEFREARDIIKTKVKELIAKVRNNEI